MIKKFTYILLAAIMLAGCIKEDREDCLPTDVVSMSFGYAFSGAGGTVDIRGQVGEVKVYVFDSLNVLSHIISVTREQFDSGKMSANIPSGKYTFVAWGTSGEDQEKGGYHPTATIGSTKLDEFSITADQNASDDLFYALAENVEVVEGTNIIVPLEFKRYTSRLSVVVEGATNVTRADPPIDVFVTGKGGLYDFNGNIHPNAQTNTWHASGVTMNGDDATYDVRVTYLDKEFHTQNPLMLNAEVRGIPLFPPLDIVDALLQTPEYNTQEDFDKAPNHPIKLVVNKMDLSVSVFINDFEIIRVSSPPLEPWN